MKAVSLNPKKILVWLLCIALIQLILYLIIATLKPDNIYLEGFWGLFNMDVEQSLPTWYSQFLFLLPALLMGWLAYTSTQTKNRVYWGGLSALMVFLSMDDGAMIHERFWIINRLIGFTYNEGVFLYSWTATAILLVAIISGIYLKFFLSLPSRTRWLFVVAGGTFITGAIGVEMVTSYIVYTTGDGVSPFVIGLEETLEIVGVSILTYALLDHIKRLPKKHRSVTFEAVD